MVAEIFNSYVCACFGHRCPHSDMKIGLGDIANPSILEVLISIETKKCPSGIRVSTRSNDYVIPDSYVRKLVFDICKRCHKYLTE